MDRIARHVVFIGHVQGVGFRYTANNIARRYDVSGYVKNLPDGTVEMLAQGPISEVDRCIANIQDAFAGYVRETRVEPVAFNSRYTDFRIAF
jgi:acylphosphatase